MYKFIEETPKHMSSPPAYAKYSQYRELLKTDFKKRCAYCNDTHKYRIRSFAIDHFVPRTPENFSSTIPENEYTNLIYSCSYCNRAKWNKWPTNVQASPNDGSKGFVKPTEDNYKDLFFRNREGRIIPVAGSQLARYIKDELMLWNPIHALMWKIEKLMKLEEDVDLRLKKIKSSELSELHYKITKETLDIFRSIFDTND